jgi:hypothetical protein
MKPSCICLSRESAAADESERLVAIHLLVGVDFIYVDHVPARRIARWSSPHSRRSTKTLPASVARMGFCIFYRCCALMHEPCPLPAA